ncbi:MAG: Gfo/Idh/MocA family oxidoreductase [Planctomycetes bacterium]|nr:Gfo/Idh/MocA family oxidoreductase [Planctomycetota bacterium]
MPYGFGIAGCGMIAHFHARAIKDLRSARLVAVHTSNPEHGRSVAEITGGCEIYTDFKAFLRHPGLDIVNVCTPSGAHLEPAVAAARAGKHVVVEKPLEITLRRCDRIIDACDQAGVKLCTIFPSRFSPANRVLKEAIDAGKFGKLTLGDTYVKWWRSQQYYDSGGWRGTWKLDGGGALMNQAIHNVDLLYWLMGPVRECMAFTDTLAHERIEVEDTAVACLRFASGALGVIEATTTAHPGLLKRVEIHGDRGTAIVEHDDILRWDFARETRRDHAIKARFARRTSGAGGAADPKAISHQGHAEQLKDFVNAIHKGTEPLVDGREGRHSVEIILAIYQSAASRRAVPLPLKSDPPFARRRK